MKYKEMLRDFYLKLKNVFIGILSAITNYVVSQILYLTIYIKMLFKNVPMCH